MNVGEILEKSKEMSIPKICKEFLQIPDKRVREKLKEIGCAYDEKKKYWIYDGSDQTILETNIYDLVDMKPRNKETTDQQKIVSSNQATIQPTQEINNLASNERKRFSVDIKATLIKQLKIKSVTDDRHIYEMVEEAITDYLNK